MKLLPAHFAMANSIMKASRTSQANFPLIKMDIVRFKCFVFVFMLQNGNLRSLANDPVQDSESSWGTFRNKSYLFVMDINRKQDLNYYEAKQRCVQSGANGLVTVDTDEEFEFLRKEIQRRVISSGQEFAHEQWWTAGMATTSMKQERSESEEGAKFVVVKNISTRRNSYLTWRTIKPNRKFIMENKTNHFIPWVWDVSGHPTVNVSALKRRTLPKKGVHFLAISHGHGQEGWRLRSLPGNYRLRYICQKYTPSSSQKSEIPSESNQPEEKASISITVHVNFTQFISFNENKLVLCSKMEILTKWNDSSLHGDRSVGWNRTTHNIPTRTSWLPRIQFSNNIGASSSNEDLPKTMEVGRGAGETSYVPEVCTPCTGDGFFFPYDKYVCLFKLKVSNSMFIHKLSSVSASEAAIQWSNHICLSSSRDSAESKDFVSVDNDTQQVMEFVVEFKRHLTFYALVLLGPTGLVTLPLMFLLKLPPEKCIKIPSIVVMVGVFTLQIQFISSLSPKSQKFVVPLIVFYPICMLVISVISVPLDIAFYRFRGNSQNFLFGSKTCRKRNSLCCCCSKYEKNPANKPTSAAESNSNTPQAKNTLVENCQGSNNPSFLEVSRQFVLDTQQWTDNRLSSSLDRRPFYTLTSHSRRHLNSKKTEDMQFLHKTSSLRRSNKVPLSTTQLDASSVTCSSDLTLLEKPSRRQTTQIPDGDSFSAFKVKPQVTKTVLLNRNIYVGTQPTSICGARCGSEDVASKRNNANIDNNCLKVNEVVSHGSVERNRKVVSPLTPSFVDSFLVFLVFIFFISYIILVIYASFWSTF